MFVLRLSRRGRRCDAPADGIIADPLACTWDPASIQCKVGRTSTSDNYCLTADQVTTLRRIYSGPTDEHGRLLYPGYQLRGSELNWAGIIVPTTATGTTGDQNFVRETLRYQIFGSPQPALTYKDIKFTAAYYKKVMELGAGIYDATDPDLSAFKKAGGKLILWHGLGDQHIPAVGTMAYYKAVEKAMGGEAATTGFARLFLLPGVAHCGGGQGPDKLDALTALTDWVTQGKAPAGLLTSTVDSTGKVTSSRPTYPFPAIAENTTGGSADDPSSYTSVKSTAEANLTLNWLGSFRSGYEQVGNWIHGKWVISKGKA
ncbi:tannase/feruloyl esterase family alpha/beta hydrolase [Streptomyces sp. NPDC090493]|uniref:tannase/feruloyl esterase family alpha/beta hydrolase n=1 Tax=Streptomyces sp. NPDC090493 TaxID=3365964 RepID=UPI00381517D2